MCVRNAFGMHMYVYVYVLVVICILHMYIRVRTYPSCLGTCGFNPTRNYPGTPVHQTLDWLGLGVFGCAVHEFCLSFVVPGAEVIVLSVKIAKQRKPRPPQLRKALPTQFLRID